MSDVEDVTCSQEYVLSTDPVTDPYSTDDENQQTVEARSFHHYYKTLYNGSDLTLNCIKQYFHLSFDTIPSEKSLPGMLSGLGIPEILDQICLFITDNNSNLDGSTMMSEVAGLLKQKQSIVNILLEDPDFHVNLKESIPELSYDVVESSTNHQMACHFMSDLGDLLKATRETSRVDCEDRYNVVKTCVTALCQLTGFRLLHSDFTTTVLTSSRRLKGKQYTTRSRTQSNTDHVMTFKSCPDLLLVGGRSPGIPIEIYSPAKVKVERNASSTPVNDHWEANVKSNAVNDKWEANMFLVNTILSDCHTLGSEISENTGDITDSLVAQHVLQVIASAARYCYRKYRNKLKLEKGRVFIGMLVCKEYVYITKLVGDEKSFVKYLTTYDLDDDDDEHESENVLSTLLGSDPDPVIHGKFSQMVFDMTVHNDRLALLIFLHYYMIKWDDINCSVRH